MNHLLLPRRRQNAFCLFGCCHGASADCTGCVAPPTIRGHAHITWRHTCALVCRMSMESANKQAEDTSFTSKYTVHHNTQDGLSGSYWDLVSKACLQANKQPVDRWCFEKCVVHSSARRLDSSGNAAIIDAELETGNDYDSPWLTCCLDGRNVQLHHG